MSPLDPSTWPPLDLRWALVLVHVGTGAIALALGPVLFARRKGDRRHRRLGTGFVALMLVTCASGAALLAWRFNPFLAGVTAFSAYNAATAWRAVRWRAAGRPQPLDAALGYLGLLAGALLWGVAIALLLGALPGGPTDVAGRLVFGGVSGAFGAVVGAMARADLQLGLAAEVAPHAWLDRHMSRVVGAYIALCTAFAVQLAGLALPPAWQWIAWVAPGVIGGRVLAPPYVRRERARWLGAAAGE